MQPQQAKMFPKALDQGQKTPDKGHFPPDQRPWWPRSGRHAIILDWSNETTKPYAYGVDFVDPPEFVSGDIVGFLDEILGPGDVIWTENIAPHDPDRHNQLLDVIESHGALGWEFHPRTTGSRKRLIDKDDPLWNEEDDLLAVEAIRWTAMDGVEPKRMKRHTWRGAHRVTGPHIKAFSKARTANRAYEMDGPMADLYRALPPLPMAIQVFGREISSVLIQEGEYCAAALAMAACALDAIEAGEDRSGFDVRAGAYGQGLKGQARSDLALRAKTLSNRGAEDSTESFEERKSARTLVRKASRAVFHYIRQGHKPPEMGETPPA